MQNAVIYRAMSTKGRPPKGQLAELKNYALTQGWNVSEIIVDHYDLDKKSPKERSGLVELMWKARLKKFDVLLAWSLRDLSREGIGYALKHLQTLRKNSVEWHFITDPLLSSQGEHAEVVMSALSTLIDCANLRSSAMAAKEYEAGKERGKRGRIPVGKISSPTLKKAKRAQDLRNSGMKFQAIAEVLGVACSRAYQLCQVDIEGEEGKVFRSPQTLTKAATAQKLSNSGMKLREIAQVMGVDGARVHQLCQIDIGEK
jgi:DNA invertase Pin-like site-specific DNA recombinase